MPGKALVINANILVRAFLGRRVREIIETYAEQASFFVPDVAHAGTFDIQCDADIGIQTEGKLGRRCRCRPIPYLSNSVETRSQSYKAAPPSVSGFPVFQRGGRTLQGTER